MPDPDVTVLPGEYRVTIDPRLTLDELVAAGRYDAVFSTSYTVGDSQARERVMRIAQFTKPFTVADAGYILHTTGYGSAGMRELLALGAAYPELQTQFPITAWLASWTAESEMDVTTYAVITGTSKALGPKDARWLMPQDVALPAGYRCLTEIAPWNQRWDDGTVVNGMMQMRPLFCADE